MEIQYITDEKGRKNAVQLTLKDWIQIQKELKELEKLREKKTFLTDLKTSVEEVKLSKKGTIKLQAANDFLDEL